MTPFSADAFFFEDVFEKNTKNQRKMITGVNNFSNIHDVFTFPW